jgi:integrase
MPFESWEQVEKVAGLCGEKYGPAIRFLCATGLRAPSELFTLRWTDLDLVGKTLTVHGTKTVNAARTVPLLHRAELVVVSLPRQLDGSLFARFDWHGFTRNHWTPALEKAGLAYRTPYEMRHTFATLALEAGAHLEDVSIVLGHANIDITRRFYAKWTKPRLDQFRTLLDGRADTEAQTRESGSSAA